MPAQKRYQELVRRLAAFDSGLIAFSGGLDSSLVLRAARDALGGRALAVTVSAVYIPAREVEEAALAARAIGMPHEVMELPLIESIRFNPRDRCYHCKRHMFEALSDKASARGCACVIDGTNTDDLTDYRPGLKALEELDIKSPLLELGFCKDEIRSLAKWVGLENWHAGPGACLLSRVPYGCEVTAAGLGRIEAAERCLLQAGLPFVRVRSEGFLARIEVRPEDRRLLFNEELLDSISAGLKALGYRYAALELEGYRSGSMNRVLEP